MRYVIRLAANISFLFAELPFLERFEAAAKAGFRSVEVSFPYDFSSVELAKLLRDNRLSLVLLNVPPGNLAAGELGTAVLPGREKETAEGFERALDYAMTLDAKLIHFLAGIPAKSSSQRDTDELFLNNLRRAADLAKEAGRIVTLEPLNRRERPGYYLNSNARARKIIASSGRDNVRLQLDLYHCQINEGDLIRSIERDIGLIGHVQIAGVPERGEPDRGEIAYTNVLHRLGSVGYQGYVGCEYFPVADTREGLAWAHPYLSEQAAIDSRERPSNLQGQ
jgi:hydroxypyruvate isomerase